MSRCSGCGGACTCQIQPADGSMAVTPTGTSGYSLGAVVAADQQPGLGGVNLLRKVGAGGLFVGREDVSAVGGGTGGGGSLVLSTPDDNASNIVQQSVTGLRVLVDGWANQILRNVSPRIVTLADSTKALMLPSAIPAAAGRASVANGGLGSSVNWHAQLPRTASPAAVTSDSMGGNVVTIPAGQSRLVAVILSIEYGQLSPAPETVAYAAKIAAWTAEWAVNMVIGPAVCTFPSQSFRFEPQPMSRNMQSATFAGWCQVPGGNHSPRLTFGLNADSLPTSPNIQVGIAGWSALMIYT